MKIYILGFSYCGKTPLAQKISKALDISFIAASGWVKKDFSYRFDTMNEYIEKITDYTLNQLQNNFYASSKYLELNFDLNSDLVIDGERNPYDFIKMFNPNSDFVIHLTHKTNPAIVTDFEYGLSVIDSYLDWLIINNLMESFQYQKYDFDYLYIKQKKTITSKWIIWPKPKTCRLYYQICKICLRGTQIRN